MASEWTRQRSWAHLAADAKFMSAAELRFSLIFASKADILTAPEVCSAATLCLRLGSVVALLVYVGRLCIGSGHNKAL